MYMEAQISIINDYYITTTIGSNLRRYGGILGNRPPPPPRHTHTHTLSGKHPVGDVIPWNSPSVFFNRMTHESRHGAIQFFGRAAV